VAGVNLVSSQTHGTRHLVDRPPACNTQFGTKATNRLADEALRIACTNDPRRERRTDSINRHIGTAAQAQKGIVTYGLAPNRQNPFAGAAHAAIFNTWRRASAQILYVVPPFVAAYYIMNWAVER
jgi:hypothetical protein